MVKLIRQIVMKHRKYTTNISLGEYNTENKR